MITNKVIASGDLVVFLPFSPFSVILIRGFKKKEKTNCKFVADLEESSWHCKVHSAATLELLSINVLKFKMERAQ